MKFISETRGVTGRREQEYELLKTCYPLNVSSSGCGRLKKHKWAGSI